jgi:hypothetical protein
MITQTASSRSTGPTSPATETCASAAPPPLRQSMLFAVDSPVSLTLSPVAALPPQTSATCGASSPESFARYGPDGSWLRTSAGYSVPRLDGSLAEFSETWPRAGMTRNGIAYPRQPLAPLTRGTGSGLWPTPDEGAFGVGDPPESFLRRREEQKAKKRNGNGFGLTLGMAVQLWPTPTANEDAAGRPGARMQPMLGNHPAIRGAGSGTLSPMFVEWLMGYPIGHTDCAGLETPSSRRSRSSSRTASSRRKKGTSHDTPHP